MISLAQVTKSFGGIRAVEALDLAVPRGSIFGLIGPNGAGKTTTLKMLSTLVKPDRGRILLGGLDIARDVREARRILGYMPDEFGTFRGVSCEEYLQFFGRAYGYHGPRLAQRIDSALDLTDLGSLRGRMTASLSAGMRQRLALAKTLLHDPEVLLLDEPASGLDPRARIEIRALLKELGKMGKTVLVSSHILADLDEICSDVAILEAGKLVWSGALAAAREELRKQRFEVSVTVPDADSSRAVAILKGIEGVRAAELRDGKIEVLLGAQGSNRLLEALIREGIEIRAFTAGKVRLEEIFLEQTRGIVG